MKSTALRFDNRDLHKIWGILDVSAFPKLDWMENLELHFSSLESKSMSDDENMKMLVIII